MSRTEDLMMIEQAVASGQVRRAPTETERAGVRFLPRPPLQPVPVPAEPVTGAALPWFPVAVETGRERTAHEALVDVVPEAYMPLVKRMFVRRGVKTETTVPLIAGYLFVRLDVHRLRWKAFNDARAVVGLVRMGLAIVTLRSGEIDRLRQLEIDSGIVPRKVEIEFNVGELMRVIDGPFTSFDGKIGRIEITKGMPRYFVEVNIFGRFTPVEFEGGQIERA